jgi:hypothetical protein
VFWGDYSKERWNTRFVLFDACTYASRVDEGVLSELHTISVTYVGLDEASSGTYIIQGLLQDLSSVNAYELATRGIREKNDGLGLLLANLWKRV